MFKKPKSISKLFSHTIPYFLYFIKRLRIKNFLRIKSFLQIHTGIHYVSWSVPILLFIAMRIFLFDVINCLANITWRDKIQRLMIYRKTRKKKKKQIKSTYSISPKVGLLKESHAYSFSQKRESRKLTR